MSFLQHLWGRNEINKEQIMLDLKRYWLSSSDQAKEIEKRLVKMGKPCLEILKKIALSESLDVNMRKAALICGSSFKDPQFVTLIMEFVDGKNPSAMLAASKNGDQKAENDFCLFRQAKALLEDLGYKVITEN